MVVYLAKYKAASTADRILKESENKLLSDLSQQSEPTHLFRRSKPSTKADALEPSAKPAY